MERAFRPVSGKEYYYDNGLIVFHYGKEEIWVEFTMNGSKMWVDPATDSARGKQKKDKIILLYN